MADVKYTAFRENVRIDSPLTSGQFASKVVSGDKLNASGTNTGDPFSFTSLKYPLDVGSNELGHFIVFYMLSANSSNVDADRQFAGKVGLTPTTETTDRTTGKKIINDIKKQNETSLDTTSVDSGNSVFSKVNTHTVTTGAITLYMPPDINVSYTQNYDNKAGTGLTGEALATFRKNTSGLEKMKEVAFGAAASVVQKGFSMLSDALSNVEGLGDPFKVSTKALGLAINPQEEQFYTSPEFRSFSYTFDFYPKNQQESREVHNILWLFKYHMAPSLEGGAGFSGRFFKVPSEFEIFYYYKGLQNDFLNKISRCTLQDLSIKYGPEGQWSTFDFDSFQSIENVSGAPPVSISATLKFVETSFLTKQQIAKGY